MRRMRPWLLLAALLTGMLHTAATDYRKLSGYVRLLTAEGDQTGRTRADSRQQQRLTAFVRTDPATAEGLWQRYGCREYARQGDISIVSIPLRQVKALADHPAVRRIEASPSAMVTMDTTTAVVHALPLYTATQEHPAFTGDGVVMGVMDVGFDLTHPNFYDAMATRYRVGALWDHLSKDTVGSEFPVGRDFRGYETVLAQQHSTDGLIQTHGTHTLGIAAGGGYDSPYRGVAYETDICLVSNAVTSDIALIDSADIGKYTTAVDALGFKYIFDYADQQGKPCVASFSEGYTPYFDEDDSLFAAFLDSLSAPGRIIVVAAGNEGYRRTYLPKPRRQETAGAFLYTGEKAANYRVRSDGPMRMHLCVYDGQGSTVTERLTIASDRQGIDSLVSDTLVLGTDTCRVYVSRYASTLGPDSVYYLALRADTTLAVRPVALVVEGAESNIEVFGSSSSAFTGNAIDPRWDDAEKGHNILAPATFPGVICVGSTGHRLGFTNYEGTYKDYAEGHQKGLRCPHSSMGPTADGRTKPDVTAPGDNIISSYSSFYLENNPEANDIQSDVAHFDYNGRTYAWNANSGTSMAAPVVAGIIALWLQAKPALTTEEVMGVFSRTCRHPEEDLTYPNNAYGFGEIDAYRGLLDILGANKIEGVSMHQPRLVRITQQDGLLTLHFDRQPETGLRVKVYALSGALCHEETVQPLGTEVSVTLPVALKGLYVVQTESRNKDYSGSQIIRL